MNNVTQKINLKDPVGLWPTDLASPEMAELLSNYFTTNKASNTIATLTYLLQRSVEHPDKQEPSYTSAIIADVAEIAMLLSDLETIYHTIDVD